MNRQFAIKTGVRFLWRDSDGALRMGVGTARHISREGVCVLAQEVPSLGARMQVIVDMPPARANIRRRRLMGRGVAIRVEYKDGQPAAFAAKVRFQTKWACPPLRLDNEVPWRDDVVVSPISGQQARMRCLGLERPGNPFL